MNLSGSAQFEKHGYHNILALKSPLDYTSIAHNLVFRQSR